MRRASSSARQRRRQPAYQKGRARIITRFTPDEHATRTAARPHQRRAAPGMKRRDLIRPWWLLPPAHVHAAWWIPVLVAMLWFDYSSGLGNQFPVVYVIPVLLAG